MKAIPGREYTAKQHSGEGLKGGGRRFLANRAITGKTAPGPKTLFLLVAAKKYEVRAVPQCGWQTSARSRRENDVVFAGAQVYGPQNVVLKTSRRQTGLGHWSRVRIMLRLDHRQPRQELVNIGDAAVTRNYQRNLRVLWRKQTG